MANNYGGKFTSFDEYLNQHSVRQDRQSYPFYTDSADYNTNSKSYYDDLARKNKLIEILAKRIWEYDEELAKRFEEWDSNLEEFPEDVEKLLIKWMEDGTLDEIINDNIFKNLNNKIDAIKSITSELKDKDKSQDEEIKKVDNHVSEIKSDVNKKIEDIVSPNPVDFVKNVDELQTKYKGGTDGIVVVNSDGYWYYYSDEWRRGGKYMTSNVYKLLSSDGKIKNLNHDKEWRNNPDISSLRAGFYEIFIQNEEINSNYVVTKNAPSNINGAVCLVKVYQYNYNDRKEFELTINYSNVSYYTSKNSDGKMLEWGVVQVERPSKPEQHFRLTYRSGGIRSIALADSRNENNSLKMKITDFPTGFYYGQISDNNGVLDRNLPDDITWGAYFTFNVYRTEDDRMHIRLNDHASKRTWVCTTYPHVKHVKWARLDVEKNEFENEQHKFAYEVNRLNNTNNFKNLIITDTHVEHLANTQQIARVNSLNMNDFYNVDDLLKYNDATIHLGDWIDGNYPKETSAYGLLKFSKEFYSKPKHYGIYGNHDYNGQWDGFAGDNAIHKHDPRYIFDKQDMLEYLVPNNKDYYFIDDNEKNIRMIYINNFDVSYKKDDDGQYYEDMQNATSIGREQIYWIVETLKNVPENYNVVIYGHNAVNGIYSDNGNYANGTVLRYILEAYQNKESTDLFTSGIDETNPVYDYYQIEDNTDLTNTNGKIIGVLSGHRHLDETKAKRGIRYIGLLCGRAQGNGTTQPVRNYHEYTRNAFSFLEFDIEQEKIILLRYGAGDNYTVDMFK
ncbi:MAG: hypothetical protein L0J44_10895 [Tetragenococcus koreensis]|nr:hypothetical protein [Tetragenococcus koreensis]